MIRFLRWLALAFALAFGVGALADTSPGARLLVLAPQASPAQLFVGGEQGAWFDPSDLSTLFQDSAGTTPVTATGDPVGKILDKSGRGNHATQATAGKRPTLQVDANGRYYLAFNGTSSSMATAAINFTATSRMTLWAAVTKLSDAATGVLTELSVTSDAGNPGSMALMLPYGAAANAAIQVFGATTLVALPTAGLASPATVVFTATMDLGTPLTGIRKNGVVGGTTSLSVGGGNFGNYPLYIGARAGTSLFLNGRLYGLIVRGASTPDAQIWQTERWANRKTGAY